MGGGRQHDAVHRRHATGAPTGRAGGRDRVDDPSPTAGPALAPRARNQPVDRGLRTAHPCSPVTGSVEHAQPAASAVALRRGPVLIVPSHARPRRSASSCDSERVCLACCGIRSCRRCSDPCLYDHVLFARLHQQHRVSDCQFGLEPPRRQALHIHSTPLRRHRERLLNRDRPLRPRLRGLQPGAPGPGTGRAVPVAHLVCIGRRRHSRHERTYSFATAYGGREAVH